MFRLRFIKGIKMKHILETLKAELEKGEKAVLCTVIDNSGSCPRGKGAHMLVSEQSKTIGTVGGGRVEYETEIKAKELLKTKKNFIQDYRLCANEVADIGMICGGNVTILFQYVDQNALDFCNRALTLIDKHEDAWIVARISSDFKWEMGFYTPEHGFEGIESGEEFKPLLKRKAKQSKKEDGSRLYAEPVSLAGQVYLFGGGHVAQAVAPLLYSVGFRYTLFEEREQFASADLFPDAEKIILSGFDDIAKEITITENDFVLIMTRGHQNDYILQVQVLKTPACYVGVIGSAAKYERLCERLAEDGFSKEQINRVITPVGLPIKAETPAEIAVSIVAQMIQVRAERFDEK